MLNVMDKETEIDFGEVQPLEVLVEYGGARTFTFMDRQEQLYLAHWLQEELPYELYLVCEITADQVKLLKQQSLTIYDIIQDSRLWIIQCSLTSDKVIAFRSDLSSLAAFIPSLQNFL